MQANIKLSEQDQIRLFERTKTQKLYRFPRYSNIIQSNINQKLSYQIKQKTQLSYYQQILVRIEKIIKLIRCLRQKQIQLKVRIKNNKKMQKIHKLLEEHRPQRLKTTHLMFQNIKNRITRQGQQQQLQTPQPNAHPSIKVINSSSNIDEEQLTASRKHKRTQSKQIPKRLKLKDYMRLNEISRQKRSRSLQSIKLQSNRKLNLNNQSDLHATFGYREQKNVGPTGTAKKGIKTYVQQAQIQRFQLINTVNKAKQKFTKMVTLIQQTNDKFTNYNDLVFMFKIEQLLNDYILKGIHSITGAYNQHFVQNGHQGVDKQIIHQKLLKINPSKQDLTICKSPVMRAQRKYIEQQKTRQKQKYKNINLLPVSIQHVNNQSNNDLTNMKFTSNIKTNLFKDFRDRN